MITASRGTRYAARDIVEGAFPFKTARRIQPKFRWEHLPLGNFLEADDLPGFLDRVLSQLSEHGGNPATLEYLRDPKLQPLALLELSSDFLIEFIEANLKGNETLSAKDLETITFADFVFIAGNTWGCFSSFYYVD